MVDIAASLSLTSNGPALDPSAILGLETADMQAFGDILAGKVATPAAAGTPANPFAGLTLPAGNRQAGGKILPDAAAVLPQLAGLAEAAPVPAGAAPLDADMPASLAVAAPTLVTAKFAAAALARRAEPAAPETAPAEPGKQAEPSPVHGLIKLLTAALKSQRPAAEDEAAPAEPEAAGDDVAPAETPAPVATIPATAIVQIQAALTLPVVAAASAAALAPRGQAETPTLGAAHAAPRAAERAAAQSAVHAALDPAQAATAQAAFQPAVHPFAAQPAVVQTAGQPVTPDAARVADGARAPVLTVAAAALEVPAAAIALGTKPAAPAARSVTAQIKLAPVAAQDAPAPVADNGTQPLAPIATAAEPRAEHPAPALRGAAAERTAQPAERVIPEFAAAPVLPVADASAQAAAPAIPGVAPATGAEPARQDFAALVERLVEARNAGAAQSTQASVQHAEFGQVSLKFQQDGGDLSVSMSSADPDFAIAAQAAMPADRQAFNANADAQPRQSQSQSQAGTSSNSQQQASAQRDAAGTDQQGRGNRGGRGSHPNDPANPSPRWGERDQSQRRGGIFA